MIPPGADEARSITCFLGAANGARGTALANDGALPSHVLNV